jgi:hypothetical protein
VVAGLGGDDQFVAVVAQVVGEQEAEVAFRAAGRRAVVVGQVEVRDAEVEGAAHDGALRLEGPALAEVVPQAERDGGQPEAAAAGAPVGHGVVAVVRGRVGHTPHLRDTRL